MRQESELGSDSQDNIESIQSVIGHAVSSLLKSGKEVGVQEILAFLKQEEARSVDGRKKLYGRAISVVAGDTDR
ncbi:hypothetical protein [Pantoea anthophila]|uniref:Uncharacterized protein n=1 Tax=Pantoea anthophila TaxID=470931 RepID=A0ABY2Z4U0_9GAMM|nr:hypothetical protein [Pantoea anthophila]TPV23656.1 hypothetical protein FJW00_14985 [Pantoea anthophila]